MTDIDQLLAGPELDLRIVREVLKWETGFFERLKGNRRGVPAIHPKLGILPYFSPSTNMNDAWMVVEELARQIGDRSGVDLRTYVKADGSFSYQYEAGLYNGGGENCQDLGYGEAETMPLAICQAALKAMAMEMGKKLEG